MLKKIFLAAWLALPATLLAQFNLEVLYGFSYMNHQQKGYLHDVGVRAIFPTDVLTHELVARSAVASDTEKHGNDARYNDWGLEYRIGMRMDNDMSALGMLSGSMYLGLGYQNVIEKYTLQSSTGMDKKSFSFLYIPLGIWGEDAMDVAFLKLRYGLNLKMILFDNYDKNYNLDKKLKFNFGFGGKVYLGLGYSLGALDLFTQAFFEYNAPMKNFRRYGLEAGLQF